MAAADGTGEDEASALVDEEEERQWLLERARRAQEEDERREREALDERLDHLPFTMREASRAVDDVLSQLLRQERLADLSLTTLHALVIARHGQPIVGIADRLRISPQAAGKAVRRLIEHGLARTSPSPTDGRVKLVDPTEKGEDLLRELRRSMFDAVCAVNDELGEGRLVALADELAAVAGLEPPGSWTWRRRW